MARLALHTKPALACGALAAVLVAAGAALGARGADPGVTPTRILLGSTAPLTGPAASPGFARGLDAYVRWVNARGGVNGRTIALAVVDDAGDPTDTLLETRTLVERNGVFAIVGPFGTEPGLATRDFLNGARVPQLFVGSGASTFGKDGLRYPWTIGYRPTLRAEGRLYGVYLARAKAGAKVAVLATDDADADELLVGLRTGIARSTVQVAGVARTDGTAVDVATQVANLRASGATVLALFVPSSAAVQAYRAASRLNWRPLVVTAAAAASASSMAVAAEAGRNRTIAGSISATFLKDPTDPRWVDDPGLRRYRAIMARFAKGASPRDVASVYGMAVAFTTVELLRAAGASPTRSAVLAQARALRSVANPFLVPGIAVRTGKGDGFPVEQALLQRWSRGKWRSFGGLWPASGR